jgi:quinol monooxygenase YgiN
MIYVIATIEVAAGRRADFLAILRANVPNVLAEDGCIEY